MRTYLTPILLSWLVFVLSACRANATATEEVAFSNVYTAAAETIAANTIASASTATPTTFPTSTSFTFQTMVPVTVTTPSVVSYSSASTANGCNNSLFVSDVTIADGTILAPSESFTKTWEFQNNGTCTWEEDYLIVFTNGTDMDGETAEIGLDVSVGDSGDISVSLIAPEDECTYTGYWRLADGSGNAFGQSVYVMIVVSDDAATTTPTPTSTTEITESESTSTPAATPTFTLTQVPTSIPTETENATPTETALP
jgi:hypothetical protein